MLHFIKPCVTFATQFKSKSKHLESITAHTDGIHTNAILPNPQAFIPIQIHLLTFRKLSVTTI